MKLDPIRTIVALALACVVSLGASAARAQSMESVTASGQVNPDRIVNGQDLGQSTRPQNLNPTGINYSDCISDMTLQFSVTLSGFVGADDANMQIWASRSGDCTQPGNRGNGGVAICWPLGSGTPADFVSTTPVTETFDVRVQDIVGPQNESPTNITYERFGAPACLAQPTSAAVPITIWFLPLSPTGASLGTAYSYPISTDLVGPPAPVGVNETVGDTLFNVNWTPSVDADTAGYDIYIDPIPGTSVDTASDASGFVQVLTCPDASVTTVTTSTGDDESGDAESDAAQLDATVASGGGGTCHTTQVPVTSTNTNKICTSVVLGSGIVLDASTSATTEVDEAGNVISTSGGGVSTIPSANLIGINAGFTIASESAGSYTITGLTNGVTYNVVVSAVDGSGNIGPPSPEVCDYPAPVNDFFTVYRNGGGLAGGGFCALEAVGVPVAPTLAFAGVGAGLIAFMRRRRRRG